MGKYLEISGANFSAQKIETVNFVPTYDVILNVSPVNSGTVTGSGSYPSGQQVQISAINNGLSLFNKWSDDDTNAQRTITVTNNVYLTAIFSNTEITYDDAYILSNKNVGVVMNTGTGLIVNNLSFSSCFIAIPDGAKMIEINKPTATTYPDGADAVCIVKNQGTVGGDIVEFATGETVINNMKNFTEPLVKILPSDARFVYISCEYNSSEQWITVAPSYIKFS